MDSKENQAIKVNYRRAADYRVLPVTGAFGGSTPAGTVICHIYADLGPWPEATEIVVSADGTAQENYSQSGSIERELFASLQMTPQVAMIIGNWLIERGKLAENDNQIQTQS
jgi:hypothetical protein